MSEPVSNVQIEDVLASIRKLVSEEVRAQTQTEEGARAPAAAAKAPNSERSAPAPEQPPMVEKLILAPHLRVADPDPQSDSDPQSDPDLESDLGQDAGSDMPSTDILFATAAFEEEAYEEAPFQDVSDEDALDGFSEPPLAFARPEPVSEDPAPELTEATSEETRDDDVEEIDFDEMLASLNAARESSTEFADFGDGAAEALAAAQHADREDLSEAKQDAQFDDLDAVLSGLEFDAPAEDTAPQAFLHADVEDAEVIEPEIRRDPELEAATGEEADNVHQFESLFRKPDSSAGPDATAKGEDAAPVNVLGDAALGDMAEAEFDAMPEHDALTGTAPAGAEAADPYADGEDPSSITVDEDVLRELVSEILRQELQGALGERITRNVRKLVRREIQRALQGQDYT